MSEDAEWCGQCFTSLREPEPEPAPDPIPVVPQPAATQPAASAESGSREAAFWPSFALALASPASPVCDVIRASGVRHWIVRPDEADQLLDALRDMGRAWAAGELVGPQSSAPLTPYTRAEQARQLSMVLEQAMARKAG